MTPPIKEKRLIPDILIHRRGKNNDDFIKDNNLLVIEMKMKSSKSERLEDITKIRNFISEYPYLYKYGLFLFFVGKKHFLEWFVHFF